MASVVSYDDAERILGLHQANERRRYKVTHLPSAVGKPRINRVPIFRRKTQCQT